MRLKVYLNIKTIKKTAIVIIITSIFLWIILIIGVYRWNRRTHCGLYEPFEYWKYRQPITTLNQDFSEVNDSILFEQYIQKKSEVEKQDIREAFGIFSFVAYIPPSLLYILPLAGIVLFVFSIVLEKLDRSKKMIIK